MTQGDTPNMSWMMWYWMQMAPSAIIFNEGTISKY